MFKYQGLKEYTVRSAIGRTSGEVALGHWFTDYNRNRHLFIRWIGKDLYHVKVFVNGTVTTDEEMRKRGLQSWAINHLQFQVTEAHFKVIG